MGGGAVHQIGVCSWSLRAEGPEDLAHKVRACGVGGVQIALDPVRTGAWDEARTAEAIRAFGLEFLSGMMAPAGEDYSTLESIRRTGGLLPDEHWEANRAAAKANAAVAQRLGLSLVTFHAGFLPHEGAGRDAMLRRVGEVAGIFQAFGAAVALETGQETAESLLGFLDDLDAPVGVNFDPANMILYGTGDPIGALRLLAGRLRQVHVKDATPARRPGEWGVETVAGEGAVLWPQFFAVLHERRPDVPLVIERENGETRIADVRIARALIHQHLP